MVLIKKRKNVSNAVHLKDSSKNDQKVEMKLFIVSLFMFGNQILMGIIQVWIFKIESKTSRLVTLFLRPL